MIFITKYRYQAAFTLAYLENLFYHSKNRDGLLLLSANGYTLTL
ncbi:unknown protein [Cronobacter turicensis z3032]|uniref:Uncharacterized protein n=1 Tax=Cronobacter turicensis (strain DSM 18703 / CCUG 55852 / LMG 23827 / z3032) TaxID=693216 RepID=C9XZ66_CROTZ|nr:unknown protein [Cronobacter turicensis z3032]